LGILKTSRSVVRFSGMVIDHLLVVLAERGLDLGEVESELNQRAAAT
jgi:phosphoribosyl-ATP pyrophosphohydrolase